MVGLLRLLVLLGYMCTTAACPSPCTCTQSQRDGALPGKKVQCNWASNQTPNITLTTAALPEDTQRLDLSGNGITILRRGDFNRLMYLQKLDLSNNQLSQIEPGAFFGLQQLQDLSLSNNKISSVNSSIFEGLTSLKKLSLSGNLLQTIPNGTFDPLTSIKRIDFNSELLLCDCRLKWIVDWIKSSEVKVRNTKCSLPSELRDTAIQKLSENELHCQWDLVLPVFEMRPSMSQIVFEGDKMPFECRASRIEPDTSIHWVRKAVSLTNKTSGVLMSTLTSPDGMLVSRLLIESLKPSDNGVWQCMVVTPRGNKTNSVTITVIAEQTLFCPAVTTKTNKGIFVWPKSVSGVTVELPCKTGPSSKYLGRSTPRALHVCDEQGQWQNLDTDQCQYESEVTRELEQLAESGNVSWVLDRAEHLTQYMNKIRSSIRDKMDVIYLSRIIQRISNNVAANRQLGEVIIQLVSLLMEVDIELLKQAQMSDKACTRMVEVIERLPQQMLHDSLKILSQHAGNIALEALEIQADSFPGLMCISKMPESALGDFTENSFVCSTIGNKSATNLNLQDDWLAMIHTPANILQRAPCEANTTCTGGDTYQLQYIVYKHAGLFPVLSRPDDNKQPDSIATPVLSFSIVNQVVSNLSSPITISLRNVNSGIKRRPVYWDFTAQGGYGQWKTDGCWVVKETAEVLTFQCDHLTSFAVLQSSEGGVALGGEWYWTLLALQPPVYAGSCVLLLCTVAVVITYAAVPGELKMSNKAKHSVGNLATSLFLLCLVFTLGVRMTKVVLACQVVGIVLHYLSICVLFWILITAYNMYRSFTRNERPRLQPLDALDSPIPHKPMLRFYLIGWGIALIVVGITAAVNLHHYADNKGYCFLSFEPSIGAFLVPAAILTTLNLIFFLRICCVLRGNTPLPLDEPETEEINELEITNNEIESLPQDAVSTSSSEDSTVDLEFRPISQLRALAAVLFLYLFTWISAAFTIARPLHQHIPYHDSIFNYAYAFFAAVLGIFLYCFYCIARRDARLAWRKACCCHKSKPMYAINANNTLMNHINGQMVRSTSSMNSEYTSKSTNTNYSNPLRYYSAKKQSNVNLVPSHSMTDPSVISSGTEAMPSFYNPRQNGAAKKYWGRKHQQKNLNLYHRDRGSEVSYSGGEGRSSKDRINMQNRLSYNGNSSDNNTHLSIEIQIQSAQVHARNHKPINLPKGLTHVNKLDGPYTIEAAQPLLPMSDFNLKTSTPMGSLKRGVPTGGENHVSRDAVPLVSLSPVGYGISPLIPAEITCIPPPRDINHYENAHGYSNNDYGEKRVSLNSELQNMEMYRPPDPPVATRGRPLSGESEILSGHRSHDCKDAEARSHHSSDSGTGSRKRKKRESFMDQLEQRIPHNKSPGLVRSNPSSREPTLTRGVRSPNASDVWSQDSLTGPQGHRGSTTQSGEESHVTSNQSSDDTHPRDSKKKKTSPQTNHVDQSDSTNNSNNSNDNSEVTMTEDSLQNNVDNRLDSNHGSKVTLTPTAATDAASQDNRLDGNYSDSSRSDHGNQPVGNHSVLSKPDHTQPTLNATTRSDPANRLDGSRSDAGNRSDHSSANTSQDGRSSQNSRRSNRTPKSWEDEFKDRPPKPAYSFVNHQYHDKVVHKLIQQSANGLIDPIARGFAWFPRSISAYEQVANDIVDQNCDSSDDSSSEGSVDDIWVLQKRKSKNKFKKETSV